MAVAVVRSKAVVRLKLFLFNHCFTPLYVREFGYTGGWVPGDAMCCASSSLEITFCLAFYLFSPTRLINSIIHEHSCKILYL